MYQEGMSSTTRTQRRALRRSCFTICLSTPSERSAWTPPTELWNRTRVARQELR